MKLVVVTVSRVMKTGNAPLYVAVTLGLVVNVNGKLRVTDPPISVILDPDILILPGPVGPVAPLKPVGPEGPDSPVGPVGPVGPVAVPVSEPPVLRLTGALLEYRPILFSRFRFA